jgi:hypothetical protein
LGPAYSVAFKSKEFGGLASSAQPAAQQLYS